MNYLRECWYQLGWSGDVAVGAPLSRDFLGEPLLIWRARDGGLSALIDRCPHRFAPLSAGALEADRIVCGYHGLAFGRDGACVHNPHGPISNALRVQSFPVIERHGAIWLWAGTPAAADPTRLPDLSFIDETPEGARIQGMVPTGANYELIVDNILDLTHADYLHPQTLGGMIATAKLRSRVEGDQIYMEWQAHDSHTPLAFKKIVPEGNCDVSLKIIWYPPALIVLTAAVTPTGRSPTFEDERVTLHNMTPETETSTHYFICSTRRFAVDDAAVTAYLRQNLMRAFTQEDKPMLEKQQARMGTPDLWSLRPAMLNIDAGAVQARRKLEKLIEAEQQSSVRLAV